MMMITCKICGKGGKTRQWTHTDCTALSFGTGYNQGKKDGAAEKSRTLHDASYHDLLEKIDELQQDATQAERQSWDDEIRTQANRAGIEHRGADGLAIVHLMVKEIRGLRR